MRKFWYLGGRSSVSVEVSKKGTREIGGYVSLGGQDEVIKIHGAIPYLFQFWLIFKNWDVRTWLRLPYDERETGWYLSWNDDLILSISLWREPMDDRGGWRLYRNLNWLLFGFPKYEELSVSDWEAIIIPMPEYNYPAKARSYTAQWKQPRKFWDVKQVRRVDIEIEGDGIPHPGKGTTSYNLDDDALYGGTYKAETIEEAVVKVQKSVSYCRDNWPL